MAEFCTGSGVAMGSNGLKIDGGNPDDDCMMLLTQSLNLSSGFRMAVACFSVFCIAVIAQFLGSINSNRFRSEKKMGRHSVRESQKSKSVSDVTQATRHGSSDKLDNVPSTHYDSPTTYNALGRSSFTGSSNALQSLDVVIQRAGNLTHLRDSFMHGLRIFVAYLLMLVVMTYSVPLVTSIVFGFAAGYYVFTRDCAKIPLSADPCCASD
uniref:Copper transport protein n=1 Tax=Albugo laibachii Nc14 TaxID=890382 RepID=F0WRW6_9STRA|nr:conserved hypothetical protein [Albugo laibachii Nc14]|eukprot:CCA24082.1 conserved hypothetical protein [Albugo laibachii Nc14]